MKFIIVVDCQRDFIDGSLGTVEAKAMIPRLVEKIRNEDEETRYIFTADTHKSDYFETPEGKALPVAHCIKGTAGWEIDNRLTDLFVNTPLIIKKPTFGSTNLIDWLAEWVNDDDEIEFVGLCTDICVISNALMAKAQFYDKAIISCDATCCAGVTPEKHAAALEVMKSCQIIVKE